MLIVAAAAAPSFAADLRPHPVPAELAPIFQEAGRLYQIDPNLLAAQAFKESRFNPRAVSRYGAEGIMQLRPSTAKALGVTDPFDPRQNILAGAKYLRKQLDRFGGDLTKALAAYNVGSTLVAQAGPAATAGAVEYVSHIKHYYATYNRGS